MILNIHGFTAEGNNSKYRWLCENAPHHEIYSPTFYYMNEDPQDILEHLVNKVSSYRRENPDNLMDVYVVGSSFGGFFAKLINQIFPDVTALLINPSLAPFLTLREHLGSKCKLYLDLLAKHAYEDEHGNQERLHVIIGDSDEVIDHGKLTKPLLPLRFKNLYTIRGGMHQLDMYSEVESIFKSIIQSPVGAAEGDCPVHYCGERKLL